MGLRIFTEPQIGASYAELLAIARASEAAGFDAFFRSDHYLKMGAATGLPAYTDAWTTLAGLARDTESIRLGTLVTPVTFRAIGSFAIVVTQVDEMSGGRVDVGLGAGWYEAEHEAYGLPFPPVTERYDLLEDELEILSGLWASEDETFDYEGKTTSVHLAPASLRPAHRPHPPIILGGRANHRGAALAARFADEFNTAFVPVEQMKATHDRVRAACEAIGRDPSTIVYSYGLTVCCGENEGAVARRAEAIGREIANMRERAVCGTPQEIVDQLGAFSDAGAERFYLQLLDIRDLEHVALLAEQVQPHVAAR